MKTLSLIVPVPLLTLACTKFQTPVIPDGAVDMQPGGAGGLSGPGGHGGLAGATGGTGGPGTPDASIDVPTTPDGVVQACPSDQKRCAGLCVNINDPKYGCDGVSCDPSACPTDVGATLKCQGLMCVLGTCGTGSKLCNGKCVSLTDPTYGCGATTCDASSCPNPGAGGSVICQASVCVIGTCSAGNKKCGGKCVAVSDPTYGCGASTCDATPCPAAGTGTLVCQGGACVVGICGAGTKKCGDKCVPTDMNNGCADAARCTACANNEACMGTPATCQCVPSPMGTACSGKCDSVSNACGGTYNCGACTAPRTCGGSGTPNVCGCNPVSMTTACSSKCGSASDGCAGTYNCGNCTLPQTCGGGGTPNVCGCKTTPMGTACASKCGSVPDGCGGNYNCGTCTSPQTCGGSGTPNVCGCNTTAMGTACASKCGSVPDGCGGNYDCGTCASPQTCGGGGTANVCGCKTTAMGTACSAKCGPVADGCGGSYNCGTCTSPQTCGGGGTPNVCGCKTVAMGTACAGKCGSVPDGCGGMFNCNTCTAPPNAIASCQNNQCVFGCAADANPFSCSSITAPACARWAFDSSGSEGWFVETYNEPTGWDGLPLSTSTQQSYSGARSLALNFSGDGLNRNRVYLHAPICPGPIDVSGRRLTVNLFFDTNSIVSDSAIVAIGTGIAGVGVSWVVETGGGGAILPRAWTSFSAVVTDASLATIVEIYIQVDEPWAGTIYVDEVHLD